MKIALVSLFAVGICQCAMGAPPRTVAVKTDEDADESVATKTKTSPEAAAKDDAKQNNSARLYGRLIDDVGKPVTEAVLTLWLERPVGRQMALKTDVDEQGNYSFDEIPEKGNYILQVDSQRWLGLKEYDEQLRLTLSPDSATKRDITLQRACRMIVRTMDEETGLPVKGVQLYVALITPNQNGYKQPLTTDNEGSATISVARASGAKYIVGAVHDEYALDHLTQVLDDPELVPRRTLSLKKGKTVTGRAVCNDGKPPGGWQVYVLPTWWKFGIYLRTARIDEEGRFQLNHIAPGKYDVMIAIPLGAQREGGAMSTMSPVLSNADLTELPEPLDVKMDYPSPSSLVYISGTVDIETKLPEGETILIGAQSKSHHYSYHGWVPAGQKEFRLGPLPEGIYSVNFFSSSIESTDFNNVAAPRDDLEVKVRPRSKPKVHGVVLSDATSEPLNQYHLRVNRVGSFGGPVYFLDSSWKQFSDPKGAFSVDVLSPGLYQVSALADGFGFITSDTIDTRQPDKAITLRLKPGVTLNGLVVDEAGNLVSGATVSSLTLAPKENSGIAAQPDQALGSVGTIDGRFTLSNLAQGKESLRVTHPDFCFLEVEGINLKADSNPELKLMLTRGATVTGRIYNERGEPDMNVPIVFHNGSGYDFRRNSANLFASVVSDRQGFYKAQHLPSQRVYVSREMGRETLGVTRRVVVIEDGKSTTLDFGGTSHVTGRLRVNGQPLSNTRLQLASGTSGFGDMQHYAMTDGEGRFVFRGSPPGRWTLSCLSLPQNHRWTPLDEVEVPANGTADLGLIEQQTGQVTINITDVPSELLGNLFVQIAPAGPATFETVGSRVNRASTTDPFVFEQIPPGEYTITAYLKNVQLLQTVKVTPEDFSPSVTMRFYTGTASIAGMIDQKLDEPMQRQSLTLSSVDGSWRSSIRLQQDQSFQIEDLPSGKYEIRHGFVQNRITILASIELNDGEKKTIHVTAETAKQAASPHGSLIVKTYTMDGAPTPCGVQVEGDNGPLVPAARFSETTTFTGPPGPYRLTAKLSGFKTVTQMVQIPRPEEKPAEIKIKLDRPSS